MSSLLHWRSNRLLCVFRNQRWCTTQPLIHAEVIYFPQKATDWCRDPLSSLKSTLQFHPLGHIKKWKKKVISSFLLEMSMSSLSFSPLLLSTNMHVHTHLHTSMHTSGEQIRQFVLSVQHNSRILSEMSDHFIGEKSTLVFLLQILFTFFTTPSPTISVLGPVISYHCSPLLLDLVSYLSLLFFVYHCWSLLAMC